MPDRPHPTSTWRVPITAPIAQRRSSAPWIVAAVLGVVFALLAVAYFVYFPNHKPAPIGGLTGNERDAVTAAGTEAANLATYSRATFEQDFARAIGGTTGALKTEVQKAKSMTEQTLTTGKFDIKATVQHSALVGPAAAGKTNSYVVLVVLFGYQSTNLTVPNPQNLQVTVNRISGKWLASDVTAVTIS